MQKATLRRVSVVCPNLSSNALGRALLLADLLRSETEVRIVGMQRGPQLWLPAAESPTPLLALSLAVDERYSPRAVRWLRETVEDDILVVTKPLPQSLGFALAARRSTRGMVVDIDDWESGLFQLGSSSGNSSLSALFWRTQSYLRRFGLNSFVAVRLLESAAKLVQQRTVSNRWLKARFGGSVLYHVRNPRILDPELAKPASLDVPRERMWVGFVGTPRPHKGLDVLVDALASLTGPRAPGLVVMGASRDAPLDDALRDRLSAERFRVFPAFPFHALRDHLALVDMVAVPSRDVPAARGQIPAKLFDAMAMAKPVIVSRLNDMPEIAQGCGLSVPAGSAVALADAIRELSADPRRAQRLGERGRDRLVARYSYDVGRQVLLAAVRAAAR